MIAKATRLFSYIFIIVPFKPPYQAPYFPAGINVDPHYIGSFCAKLRVIQKKQLISECCRGSARARLVEGNLKPTGFPQALVPRW